MGICLAGQARDVAARVEEPPRLRAAAVTGLSILLPRAVGVDLQPGKRIV